MWMYNTRVSHVIGGVEQPAIPHTTHTYHIWADDTPHLVFKPYFHSLHPHISKSNSSLTADTWPFPVCTKHTVNHKKNRNCLRKDEDQLQSEFMHADKRTACKISDKKPCIQRCTCEINRAVEGWNLNATRGIKFYVDKSPWSRKTIIHQVIILLINHLLSYKFTKQEQKLLEVMQYSASPQKIDSIKISNNHTCVVTENHKNTCYILLTFLLFGIGTEPCYFKKVRNACNTASIHIAI